ncbi:MAG TPA: 3'(2'),5'-bisphosphate nucleotidase CysQ [Longimicrobiales bacterium]|nr:3'(2'),5'-bisphosphate nucleotidase CysQ [Longimicrobiales bacterium]
MADDRQADLELALRATGRAAAVVMEWFRTDLDVRHKEPGQPVTAADLTADRMLREDLAGARPDYGWLSEETADGPDRLARSRVWVVDPVDGTRSFVEGEPEFALSVGLSEDGAVVVGVVCNPAAGKLYWAVRGGGAYVAELAHGAPRNQRRLAVPVAVRRPLTLLASRHEVADGELRPFLERGWRLAPTGSTAYKLARLAAGDGDVFLSRGPKSEWDVCAGALLVQEAGGSVSDLRGEPFRYNRRDPAVYGVLATAAGLHAEVLAVVAALPETARMAQLARPRG